MRLHIVHDTQYRYSSPAVVSQQLALTVVQ